MKLKQKQPTKQHDERTTDVLKAIGKLSFVSKYPAEENQAELVASCIADFCQTVEVLHADPDDPRPDDLGWVVPLDWLVREVAQTCTWFPTPIQWRAIYERRFTPLDGKASADMKSIIGED